jgi:hypothetical protein
MWAQGGRVKVPYAKKWQKEADKLRKIVLDCDLTEERKWGKPCFTCQKKNVAIIIPLKDACALSFFKGALLKDPKHILQKIGQAQAGRWIKFTRWLRGCYFLRIGCLAVISLSFRVCGPRGVAGQAGCSSGAAGGIRSAHSGTEKVVHLSCLGCEAGEDPGRAGGEVCPHDLERSRLQRAWKAAKKFHFKRNCTLTLSALIRS